MRRSLSGSEVSSYVAFHFVVLGLVSWFSGQAFLIPSLGPSVYALATLPDGKMNYPERIIGGQFIGAVSGFVAYSLLVGHDPAISSAPPLSLIAFKQVAATFVAAILTTVGMHTLNTVHPPAYATTMIVALGLLTGVIPIVVFMVAVLTVTGVHELAKRSPVWSLPYERKF